MDSTIIATLSAQVYEYVARDIAESRRSRVFPVFSGLNIGTRGWWLRAAAQHAFRLLPFVIAVSEEEDGAVPLNEEQFALAVRREQVARRQEVIARIEVRLPKMSLKSRESAEAALASLRHVVARLESGESIPKTEKLPRSEKSRQIEQRIAGVLSRQIAEAQKVMIDISSEHGN